MDLSRAEVERRQDLALELHLAGLPYSMIAQRVGYKGKTGAHRAVIAARKRHGVGAETVADSTQSELERLDRLMVAMLPLARRGDVHAVDRVIRIDERRHELIAERERRGDDGYQREPDPHGPTQAQREDSLAEFRRRFEERRRAAGAEID